MLKIRNSVFTQKELNPEVLNTVLTIESKLHDLNEGEKIEQIAVFTTEDLPFSLAAETITQSDFTQIATFFKEINFLDDYFFEKVMDQIDNEGVEYFTKFITANRAADIEAFMIRMAFGGFPFDNFDFRNKESQEALAFVTSYGYLPIYEIADIEKRNQSIKMICDNLIADLKIGDDTEMYQFFMCDALSDPSNSEFRILFWVTPNAIITFKSHVSV
jgi:hypothetical protein